MWQSDWRDRLWTQLDKPWDVIVVGGGITGAGILRLSTHLGLRTLLVERNDFAWGTSSRSTKLVHGGLRYLAQGQYGVTRQAVREREWLLKQAPGLVDPLGCLLPAYEEYSRGRWAFNIGLSAYDLMGHKWQHRYFKGDDFLMLAPHLSEKRLRGGFRYVDAVTDDARLVLRVIREAVRAGAAALNYASADAPLLDAQGRVRGVALRDRVSGLSAEVKARVVVNATGAWADSLRGQIGAPPRVRPSRGSHLLFPYWKLPVAQAITLIHPRDGRFVFVLPWEGAVLAGTTDLDHRQPLDDEPSIDAAELDYMMTALDARFPALRLTARDALATFAGIRPIVGTGKGDPSKESRAHVVLDESGLVTITGGKLTTFRPMAADALRAALLSWPGARPSGTPCPMLDPVPPHSAGDSLLDADARRRLFGRHGQDVEPLLSAAVPDELERISGTHFLWAELRWAARDEGVVHLEDLLLRRVRLGLLLPEGGAAILERVRAIAQPELGWEDARWQSEVAAYRRLWSQAYSVPH